MFWENRSHFGITDQTSYKYQNLSRCTHNDISECFVSLGR